MQILQNRPSCMPRWPSVWSSYSTGSSTTRSPTWHPQPGLSVHRDAVQHSTVHSGALLKMRLKVPPKSSLFTNTGWPTPSSHPAIYRLLGMVVFMATTWKTPPMSNSVVGRHSLVPEDWWLVRPDHSSSVGTVRGGLVGISSSPAGSSPLHKGNGSHSLHRCVHLWLGSLVRLTLDTETVVSLSKIVSYQRSGDAGRHQRRESLPSSFEVPSGALDVRQCSDNGLNYIKNESSTRSYTLMQLPLRLLKWCDRKAITLVPVHLPGVHNIQADPLSRVGQTLNTEWTMGHGASPTSICPMGWTTGWLVRDIRQQISHQVCVTVSGPQGRFHGRHVGSLGQREGPPVRFSTVQDGPSSPAEGRSVSRCSDDSDHSSAGNSFLVPGTFGPVPRRFHPAVQSLLTQDVTLSDGGGGGGADSSLPAVKSSRVETLGAILVVKGHSQEAAHMMSRALWESSLHVYESHWARFVSFCRSKRWHVFRARSHHFSTYMMHLFRDGLPPSTIFSHHTSVASVLRHWVYDPAADPNIKLLIRAFRLERPVQRKIMPKWGSHLVLMALMRPPFASECADRGETSNDFIPLKWWTMKTVFLLALASVRRRTYIHALSVSPDRSVFSRGNTQCQLVVSLLPEPGFLAKKQLPSQAPEWISAPSIAHLNLSEAERMFYPVRQLKLYLRDWERIRGADSGCSFIGTAPLEISWEFISADGSWRLSKKPTLKLIGSTTELQHMRSEPCQHHGVLEVVRSLPEFLSMACIADGMSMLGPVVVAQQVVDLGHLLPPP